MRPRFWFNPPETPGLLVRGLSLLSPLCSEPMARWRAPCALPVVAVHMPLIAGLTRDLVFVCLAQALQRLSRRPVAVLSAPFGQGARVIDPRAPDPTSPPEAGFLADFLPVVTRTDPVAPVDCAALTGADTVLAPLHFGAKVAMRVLVVDAGLGLGNGRCWPAGPLARPAHDLLGLADLVVLVGAPARRAGFLAQARAMGWPLPQVLEGQIGPLQMGMDWDGADVFAFSALSRPAPVFAALAEAGARLHGARALPPDRRPPPALLRRLAGDARRVNAQLVTTEADALTLPPAFRAQVLALPLRLELEPGLEAALNGALG